MACSGSSAATSRRKSQRPRATTASTIAAVRARSSSSSGGERARRHGAGHQAADLLVARIVHHVEQDAGREPGRQVLDQRAAAVAGAAALRGEGPRVGGDGEHVGVAAHHPEALAAGGVRRRRVEPHRGLAAQAREDVVREAVREAIEVGQVDVDHRCRVP